MRFLIDVNLPKKFRYFNFPNFEFVCDIDLSMSDRDIWNYAIQNNQIIVTKDADFYDKYLISKDRPKVIYFLIGNYSLKELHTFFEHHWEKIIEQIQTEDFLFVYEKYIQSFND